MRYFIGLWVMAFVGGFFGSSPSPSYLVSVGILGNLSTSELGPAYSMERTPSLHILGPPVYTILEGAELALVCRGGDEDSLYWRRKGGVMPNGEPSIAGGQVIIHSAGRGDGGEYQCMATSPNGATLTANILVTVLYPPTVSVHKLYISNHNSLTLELVCS